MTASYIQRGYDLINRLAGPIASESVRYLRGEVEIASAMSAILTRPQIELVDQGGAALIGRKFSWELSRSQLIVNGAVDRPRQDDIIKWIHNGREYSFTIQPEVGATPEAGAVDPRSDWVPATTKLTNDVLV